MYICMKCVHGIMELDLPNKIVRSKWSLCINSLHGCILALISQCHVQQLIKTWLSVCHSVSKRSH